MVNEMIKPNLDVLGLGYGPSNIALAISYEELEQTDRCFSLAFAEKNKSIRWHEGILLPWTVSQVSFLKDLVTLRNPRSRFTFLNFLKETGKLDEFVNLGTFTPLRLEISDYLEWAGRSVEKSSHSFDHECVDISGIEENGRIVGWRSKFSNGGEVNSSDLVVSVGRDLNVPAEFKSLPKELVFHSENYLYGIKSHRHRKGLRVAVIGSAQSAAEVFKSLHSDLEDSRPTIIMRKAGFRYYDTSPYLNELFQPGYVDKFYQMPHGSRQDILQQMHTTNYGGLAPYLLNDLYRMQYLQRAMGEEPSQILSMKDIVAAEASGGKVIISLRDKTNGEVSEEVFDLVVLGTGFKNKLPEVMSGIQNLIPKDETESCFLSRDYQVSVEDGVDAGLFLQGLAEGTHGIADTLLSNLADRSDRIVKALVERQRARRALQKDVVAAE